MKKRTREILYGVGSEIALFLLLLYLQYLFSLDLVVNIWFSSLILLALLNGAIAGCPFVRRCYHRGF